MCDFFVGAEIPSQPIELPWPTRQSLPLQRRRQHLSVRSHGSEYDYRPAYRTGYNVPTV